jgi:hypothetical protein
MAPLTAATVARQRRRPSSKRAEKCMLHPVLAYIDPGSGSLIIQVAIASIIAIPVIFRAKLAQITRAFRRDKSPAEGTDDTPVGQ